MPKLHKIFLCALVGWGLGCLGPAPARGDDALDKADRIVVFKAEHRLDLLRDGKILRSYPIALGFHPIGPKERQGDGRTPEGLYVIDGRSSRSPYHRMLHISYPNARDRMRAAAGKTILGDAIAIHGMPNRYGRHDPRRFFTDWTNGCIAVGNVAIEEIWASVDNGTPVEIRAGSPREKGGERYESKRGR